MNVFVDTSAFYALVSESDENHADASARWDRLLGEDNVELHTTSYVVIEVTNLLHKRLGVGAVWNFAHLLLPAVTIHHPDGTALGAALSAVLAGGRSGPSIVDCTSFALMQGHGFSSALAYDAHFTRAGFTLP